MKYYKDEPLSKFEFWSGGYSNADLLTFDELDQIGDELEAQDYFAGEIPSDTEINNLFWFNFGDVLKLIGLTKKEAMDRAKNK